MFSIINTSTNSLFKIKEDTSTELHILLKVLSEKVKDFQEIYIMLQEKLAVFKT